MSPKKGSPKTTPAKAKKSAKVTPARGACPIEDTVEIMRSYLFAMHKIGIESVDEKEILMKTRYKRTDSTGYRKAAAKLIKELGHATRSKGQWALTAAGLEWLEENGTAVDIQPASMEDHQKQLFESLCDNAKAPNDKIEAMWSLVMDGKPHSQAELLQAGGYNRPDSTGYREFIKWCKKMELVEVAGKKAFRATDKVYRYGARPTS